MTKLIAALGFLVLALPAHAHPGHAQTAPQAGAAGAWLGVSLQDLDDDLREAMDIPASLAGVLVPQVLAGSPARQAGLKAMDVITGIDGRSVSSSDDVIDHVGDLSPGKNISIVVWRDGVTKTLSATLGSTAERPNEDIAFEARPRGDDSDSDNGKAPRAGRFSFDNDDKGDDADAPDDDDTPRRHRIVIRHSDGEDRGYLGVRTMELGEQLAAYFGVKEDEGVLVTEVLPDSPAQKAGLEAGDVILSVAGDAVGDPEDLRHAIRRHDAGATVDVRVHRRGSERTLSVTLAEAEDFGMAVPYAPGAPHAPHALGWHGQDLVIPLPDLRGLEMDMDPEEWKRFQQDLRQQMDELREELRDLRLKIRGE